MTLILRFSDKEIAAIEAVLDIALNGGGGPVQSRDITRRQGIPPRYLEPVLQQLGRAGLIVGIRGPNGGYRLARERRRITLADLLNAMEPERTATHGSANDDPLRSMLQGVFEGLESDMQARLAAVTVEALCWRAHGLMQAEAPDGKVSFSI